MKKMIAFGVAILALLVLVLNMIPKVYANFFEDGYAMPDVELTEVLGSKDLQYYESIQLSEVKENESYQERFGKIYTDDDVAINLDYPIIINDHSAMRFMNKTSYVIDTSFRYARIVERSIISGETYFNEDGRAVDNGEYMMVQLPNKLFISASKISFINALSTQEINRHSIYYFDEDFVNVYEYENGFYHFKAIRSVENTTVKVGDMELSYPAFYEKLLRVKEVIVEDIEKQDEIKEEIKDIIEKEEKEDFAGKPSAPAEPDKPSIPEQTPTTPPQEEPETPEMEYVKPEVTVSDVSAWVYTINGNIKIQDPSSRLLDGVVFYVYNEEGELVLRQNVNRSGMFDLSILEPDKTFVVNAQFEYYNRNDLIASEMALENTVLHTKVMEGNVYPVSFLFETSSYAKPKSIVVDSSFLKNTSDYQEGVESLENFYKNTLPYISRLTFVFDGGEGTVSTNIPNRALNSLKNGNDTRFETNNVLKSNTTYNYIVQAYDKFGNEITLNPSVVGSYTTSKSNPSVRTTILKADYEMVELKIQLFDEDNTLSSKGYEMELYDMNGDAISFEYEYAGAFGYGDKVTFSKDESSTTIKVKNLPPLNRFNAVFRGDYNLENGEGLLENQKIGDFSFLSGQLPTGTIHFENTFYSIGDSYATMDLSLSRTSTTELLNFMTNISTSIKAGNQEIKLQLSENSFNRVEIDKKYDNKRNALMIQSGNAKEGKPEVLLVANKETLLANGAWRTFINSGILGSQHPNAGYIQVNYLPDTLIPKTTYHYSMKAGTDVNGIKKELNTDFTTKEFTTLSIEPIIGYDDFFLAQNFIELYEMNAVDDGDTIVNDEYLVQLFEGETLVETYELKVGEPKDVLRFNGLSTSKNYKLQIVIPQYKASVNSDLVENYVLSTFHFKTDEGVSANFDIDSIRNGYDRIHDDKFVMNITDITYGTTYNIQTKMEEADPDHFITGYIPYNKGSYKVIQNFAAPGNAVTVIYFKADKSYAHVHNLTPTNGVVNDEHCLNAFNNNNYAFMRIVGQTGYEKNARFYDLTISDLDELINLKSNPDAFVEGISPGTTGFDSANPSRTTTDYFSVTPGETLYYKSNRTRYLYFYTIDHKYISYVGGAASSQNNIVDVPANAAYARFSIDNLNKDEDVAVVYRIKNMMVQDYDATFRWTIQDNGDDQFALSKNIEDEQYYIRKYVSESIDIIDYKEEYTKAYPLETIDGTSIDILLDHDETLPSKRAFRYEIVLKYHGREIVIDRFEMDTKNSVHLIRNASDLKQIQYDSFGTFIAVNDIIEDETIFSLNANFGGTLDFQNHSLILCKGNANALIYDLNPGGVIKNINVILKDPIDRWFVTNNYGRISNLNYTIQLDKGEFLRMPLINQNTKDGIIENFVIQLNGDVVAYNENTTDRNNILTYLNGGIIRNGYVYNTDKTGMVHFVSRKGFNSRSGVISGTNNGNGSISNVYAEVNIASDYNSSQGVDGTSKSAGIISANNAGRVNNIFGVGTRYSFDFDYDTKTIRNLQESTFDDPLFGHVSAVRKSGDNEVLIYQNVLFYETDGHTYTDAEVIADKFDIANLYDEKWYSSNINSDQQFDVSYVSQGYYPLVNSSDGARVVGQTLNPLPRIKEVIAPEFLDYVVSDVQNEYVDVVFKFKNESKADITKIHVENLNSSILEQDTVNDIYEVKVRLNQPQEYVTGYRFVSFEYRTLQSSKTVDIEPSVSLDISFYKTINNIEEWSQWLCNKTTRKLNYNYRLGNTLDFSGVSGNDFVAKYRVDSQFNGKLDGNGYAIQNIDFKNDQPKVSSVLFQSVNYGEIKNLEIRNITWHKKDDNTISDNGIINDIRNSNVDHVNISNVNLTGKKRVGGFASYANSCDFTNMTANRVVLRKNNEQANLYMGGLIAEAHALNVRNSYVRDVDILTERVDLAYVVGIGGMLGYSGSSTRLQNVYVTGKIKTTSYAGGIAGSGTYSISEAYSDVYMETDGDYNAGIAGTIHTDASVKNSFSVGNFIHAISNPLHTNRIISSENYWFLNNNYGYVNQTFNNQIKDELDSSALLTYEDLCNEKVYTDRILLSNHFDYEGVSKGVLPKLKDTDGHLLPYQSDHYLASTILKVQKLSSDIEVSGNSEYYNATIRVDHEGYVIDSITIDGMQILEGYPKETEIIPGVAHRYEIKSYKLNAYDKYNLKVKMHAVGDTNQTKELVLSLDYGRPLYWKISDYASWQSIMESHGYGSENIMISGVVDFTGKDNVYHNITANRFEGDPANVNVLRGYTLKGSSTDSNLIATIYGNISDIRFEDISLQFDGSNADNYRYVGVIGIVQGEVSDLTFKNCSITDYDGKAFLNKGNSARIAMISNAGGNIEDIEMEDIEVLVENTGLSGNNNVAGLVALTYNNVRDITAKNVHIDAVNGFYVGGIIGYADRKTTEAVTIENIKLTSTENNRNLVKGLHKVGGAVGTTSNVALIDAFAENVDVVGYKNDAYDYSGYIGGVVGSAGTFINLDASIPTIKNANVTAEGTYGRAGGVAGSVVTSRSLSAEDVTVTSTIAAGGILGQNASSVTECSVKNAKVVANTAAGGIQGIGYGVSNSSVINTEVEAKVENAGGITGAGAAYDIHGEMTSRYNSGIAGSHVIDSKIRATKAGGGLIGMAYSSGANANRNFIHGSTIEVGSGGYAGGILGKGDGYSLYHNIVHKDNIITNAGNYTGGIVGSLAYIDVNYNSSFYQNISAGQINGADYTGGIVGYFNGNITSASRYTNLYSNLNMATIQARGANVYGFGTISESALKGSKNKYHLASYSEATINGQPIADHQLANLNDSAFEMMTLEDFADFSTLTSAISETNYNFDKSAWNNMLNISLRLENFAISFKGYADDKQTQYKFKIEGVQLNDGDYRLDIMNSQSATKPSFQYDIKIEDGVVKDASTGSDIIVTNNRIVNSYMTIYRMENGNRVEYAKSEILGIYDGRTYHKMLVDGVEENYRKAKIKDADGKLVTNDIVTLHIDNPGDETYNWYRLYRGNGYGSYLVNVTHMASEDTHSLKTNLPGVYYAQGKNDTKQLTELFRYDGVIYYPFVSSNATTVYEGQEYIPLAEVYKNGMITQQEPEVTNFPTYDVYPSGINTINVEFNDVIDWKVDNPKLKITLVIDGQEYTYPIDQRVMSFGYDYGQTDGIGIYLSDDKGVHTKLSSHSNDSIRQSISLTSDYYYYIDINGNISGGSTGDKKEMAQGNFVHLYDSEALKFDDNNTPVIVDLTNSSEKKVSHANGSLLGESLPLKTDTIYVDDQLHRVSYYHNFMYDEETKSLSKEMIYNTNANKSAGYNGSNARRGNGLVLDFFKENDEEIFASYYLSQEGKLVFDTSIAKLPEQFSNAGISELAFNVKTNQNDYVMIKYPTKVYIFDYANGKVIFDEMVKEASSFSFRGIGQFASEYFDNFISFLSGGEPVTDIISYDHMINELERIPNSEMSEINSITLEGNSQAHSGEFDAEDGEGYNEEGVVDEDGEVVIEGDVVSGEKEQDGTDAFVNNEIVSREYVPVYNPNTKSYDIYTTREIVENRNPKSENAKIEEAVAQGYKLSDTNSMFNKKSKEVEKDFIRTRIVLYFGIFVAVIILLMFLKNRVKNIKKK